MGIIASVGALPTSIWAFFMDKLYVRTVEKDDFVFENNSILWKSVKKSTPYALIIGGLVENKTQLAFKDLLNLPQVTQDSDFHCVEGWSVKDLVWQGIRFEQIVKIAKPVAEAKYALFHALGETDSAPHGQRHYIECLPIEHLLNPGKECLLAITMNGKPLTHEHGAPLRLISPYDLGYKSIKYVCGIDFIKTAQAGWWTLANPIYPSNAPVPASRLRKK